VWIYLARGRDCGESGDEHAGSGGTEFVEVPSVGDLRCLLSFVLEVSR
jgi:hypothetical protein